MIVDLVLKAVEAPGREKRSLRNIERRNNALGFVRSRITLVPFAAKPRGVLLRQGRK
jgi:hypothetical protein